MLSFFQFLDFSSAADRPVRLDHFTIHVATDTLDVSIGWVFNSVTNWWSTASYAPVTPPANPIFYVSQATGSDAASQPGTIAAPLLTPQEAARRLGVTRWSGSAFVRTLDTKTLGASPVFAVPPPSGNALPICFQGTYTNDLTGVVCTSGSLGTATQPITGGTFITTNNSALNAHRGKILVVTAGPNAGTRYVIEGNTAGPNSAFTVAALLAVLPTAATVIDIQSRTGKWTWSGEFTFDIPGGAILDGLDMLPTGANARFTPVGTTLQEGACRYLTAAAGFRLKPNCVYEVCNSDFSLTATSTQLWNPTGVTPCGNMYDGSAALGSISGGSDVFPPRDMLQECVLANTFAKGFNVNMSAGGLATFHLLSIFDDCGFSCYAGGKLSLYYARLQTCRPIAGKTAIVSAWKSGSIATLYSVTFVTPAAGHLTEASYDGFVEAESCSGQASGAGKLAVDVGAGGQFLNRVSNTFQGTTAGNDYSFSGCTPLSSLPISVHRSGVIPFVSTLNESGVPAVTNTTTANVTLGIFSLAAASGAVFTWNSPWIKAADVPHVALHFVDATAKAPVATVVDGTITITFAAAATLATKFSVLLLKPGANLSP